jgi:hypothetical protein
MGFVRFRARMFRAFARGLNWINVSNPKSANNTKSKRRDPLKYQRRVALPVVAAIMLCMCNGNPTTPANRYSTTPAGGDTTTPAGGEEEDQVAPDKLVRIAEEAGLTKDSCCDLRDFCMELDSGCPDLGLICPNLSECARREHSTESHAELAQALEPLVDELFGVLEHLLPEFFGALCPLLDAAGVPACVSSGGLPNPGGDTDEPEKNPTNPEMCDETDKATFYEDCDWAELPAEVQTAAATFGYTETAWNEGGASGDSEDLWWYQLTEEQQKAAKVLGYDEDAWNDLENIQLCDLTHKETQYENCDWYELPTEARDAATTLGYDRAEKWDRDQPVWSDDYWWRDLDEEQQRAAATLGYSEESWDEGD